MAQKTYWHLNSRRRIPSEYEVASSKLLYYPGRGFETASPVDLWYQKYQKEAPFHCGDWELFEDPRETTYSKYTSIQSLQETYIDGLLTSIDNSTYDVDLSTEWVQAFSRFIAPLRYPWHGFQMIACYVGQMAPGSRVTLTSMFQAGDEIRRIQRIAYRLRQIQIHRPECTMDSLQLWMQDPIWQPLREAIEKLLVVRDWGEAFTGLNLVLKPFIDNLFLVHFGKLAALAGDHILQQMFNSFDQDCQWQRQWARTLVQTVLKQQPGAKKDLRGWVEHWSRFAGAAVRGFEPAFRSGLSDSKTFGEIVSGIEGSVREHMNECGLAAI